MTDLSIIIPAYNVEKTIGDCLDSILNQIKTLSYEIIIIDDGSIDNTQNIIQLYQQKYSQIVYIWQENQKQSVARNKGLNIAKGSYIFFFDADDIIIDDMISKMYDTINGCDKNDLVVCGIKKIFCSENTIITEKLELASCLDGVSSVIPAYLSCSKEMDVGLWNKIFKRSIIEKYNIRFNNSNFFEDSLFVLHYLLAIDGNTIYLNQPLYFLFKRQGSTTGQYNRNIVNYALSYIEKAIQLCSDFNVVLSKTIINSFILRIYLHLIHHNIKNNKDWNDVEREELKKIFDIKNKMIFHNNLSIFFKTALVCHTCFPNLYTKLYRKFMPN